MSKQIIGLLCFLVSSALSSFSQNHPNLIPQVGHGAPIISICEGPRHVYVFSADELGNIKQWEIGSQLLFKNIKSSLRQIDYMKAFGSVGKYYLIAYSKNEKRIHIIDYVNDSLIKSISYTDELLDVTENYHNSAKSLNKYGKVVQFHGKQGRMIYDPDGFGFVKAIAYPDMSGGESFVFDEFAENFFVGKDHSIYHYTNSEYGSNLKKIYPLGESDGTINNLVYIAPSKQTKEALLISMEHAFYYLPLYNRKLTRYGRSSTFEKNTGPLFGQRKKSTYTIKHDQLAYSKSLDLILFGEVFARLSSPDSVVEKMYTVPKLDQAFFAFTNYTNQNVLVGYDSCSLVFFDPSSYFTSSTFGKVDEVRQIAVFNDQLFLNTHSNFHAIDLNTFSELENLQLPMISKEFSIDGQSNRLAIRSVESKITLPWNGFVFQLSNGKLKRSLPMDSLTEMKKMRYQNSTWFCTLIDSTKVLTSIWIIADTALSGYEIDEFNHGEQIIDFEISKNYLAIIDAEGITIYNIHSRKKIKRIKLPGILGAVISPNGYCYFYQQQKVYAWSKKLKKAQVIGTYNAVPDRFKILENSELAIIKHSNPVEVELFNGIQSQNTFTFTQSYANDIAYRASNNQYIIAFKDGSIHIKSPQLDGRIIIKEDRNKLRSMMLYDDDDFYLSNLNAFEIANFRDGKELFPLSHYDLFFNRPHRLLKKTKSSDQEYISIMEEIFDKRAQRYHFNEDLFNDQLRPELFDLNDSTINVTTNDTVNFLIHVNSEVNNISNIQAYANGVPVLKWDTSALQSYFKQFPLISKIRTTQASSIFDMAVLFRNLTTPLSDSNSLNRFRLSLPIELALGMNTLEIYCTNSSGIRSKIKTYMIEKKPEKPFVAPPDLYVYAISVSNYQDSAYNLTYARKDGRDLLHKLKNNRVSQSEISLDMNGEVIDYSPYSNIYIDSLFDEEVTLTNIAQINDFFAQSKPEDRIILFISGHGVLDKKNNFWYASYDMNFSKPSQNGISYDLLEKTMVSAPSRHRLMLMDACHSGEVDQHSTKTPLPNSQVVAGSKGVFVTSEDGPGLQNSFELMKAAFADVTRSSGINVIAAAAGNSYALESDEWQNGIFTYCLLKALEPVNSNYSYNISWAELDLNNDLKIDESEHYAFHYANQMQMSDGLEADRDLDNYITIAELKNYVSTEVERMTNGLQKPTTRKGNIEFDFQVW